MITETMVHGSFYKVGLHNKVFRWVNGRWIRSSKTRRDLIKVIHRESEFRQKERANWSR